MNEYFVYTILDPHTKDVMFVGAGKAHAGTAHFKHSKYGYPRSTHNQPFYAWMKKHIESGHPPILKYIHDELPREEAMMIKKGLIANMGTIETGGPLFNVKIGDTLTKQTKDRISEYMKENSWLLGRTGKDHPKFGLRHPRKKP